ncbi:MAG: T9SS type A sorting domain-containing protein [Candidatus Latescibacteria bacterium]|nr:T9SS type A sorting domain-containing protein [Candidatus Latescibacterota bacterium]
MLYKLNDSKKWEQVFVLESGTTYSPQFLTVTPDSIVWTFDDQNVYRYIEDKWKLYESGFDLASDVVTCHVYTENGDLLCGHGLRGIPPGEREDKGLSIRIGSEWQNDTKFGNTELLNVYQFAKMPDGEIMALTDGGYKQYYNYSWEKIDSVFVYNQYDMLFEEDETMWIASYYGLIEHAEDDYTLHIPFDEDKDIPVYNLSLVDEEYLYMQLLSGDIISFDGDIWETVTGSNSLINDFAVDDNLMIWAASQVSLAYWDKELNRFVDVVELDNGRFVYIDEQGKIWSSGHGNTGYFENGVWNSIPELSDYASDAISTSIDGRVALNVFDSEREEFFGLFEYRPQTMGVSHNEYRPEPLISTVNHPNPFNAITTITFELPKASNVSISVYSISGQLVKTIAEKRFPAGKNNVVWNSTSDTGRKLASGLYIYRIIAGSSVASGKMLLLR